MIAHTLPFCLTPFFRDVDAAPAALSSKGRINRNGWFGFFARVTFILSTIVVIVDRFLLAPISRRFKVKVLNSIRLLDVDAD
jgi:hypothetical protein